MIHLSSGLLMCLPDTPLVHGFSRTGISPASSKAKSDLGLSQEHKKCCNSLRAIRGEDAKECARHWIALCWGRGGVHKKIQLGQEPFSCCRRGGRPWNIEENHGFSICLAKQKQLFPTVFPQLRRYKHKNSKVISGGFLWGSKQALSRVETLLERARSSRSALKSAIY